MLSETPKLLETIGSTDGRGSFGKPFYGQSKELQDFKIVEVFWSQTRFGGIRGMHFQKPDKSIKKLVWVSQGSIIDVVVDLRTGPTFGKVSQFQLTADVKTSLLVPSGFAHGFQALTDGVIVNYATDGEFSPEHDAGIHWNSIGVNWPIYPTAVSERDEGLIDFAKFQSPFAGVEE